MNRVVADDKYDADDVDVWIPNPRRTSKDSVDDVDEEEGGGEEEGVGCYGGETRAEGAEAGCADEV
ncbi:hypothetical protein HYFRA_00012464 [Hymenoscyphus fraxineus]|uniref:Uncharacterized protein n=1 Tax=Hymenoscyphus fraxineus TaxID=746836 RepID=A0A9N9L3D4_9HELO|nr:hypothetical protein HYFRA_00012464 [Hymenoscyphus fraxineus]